MRFVVVTNGRDIPTAGFIIDEQVQGGTQAESRSPSGHPQNHQKEETCSRDSLKSCLTYLNQGK
jgi:hypothetical protein